LSGDSDISATDTDLVQFLDRATQLQQKVAAFQQALDASPDPSISVDGRKPQIVETQQQALDASPDTSISADVRKQQIEEAQQEARGVSSAESIWGIKTQEVEAKLQGDAAPQEPPSVAPLKRPVSATTEIAPATVCSSSGQTLDHQSMALQSAGTAAAAAAAALGLAATTSQADASSRPTNVQDSEASSRVQIGISSDNDGIPGVHLVGSADTVISEKVPSKAGVDNVAIPSSMGSLAMDGEASKTGKQEAEDMRIDLDCLAIVNETYARATLAMCEEYSSRANTVCESSQSSCIGENRRLSASLADAILVHAEEDTAMRSIGADAISECLSSALPSARADEEDDAEAAVEVEVLHSAGTMVADGTIEALCADSLHGVATRDQHTRSSALVVRKRVLAVLTEAARDGRLAAALSDPPEMKTTAAEDDQLDSHVSVMDHLRANAAAALMRASCDGSLEDALQKHAKASEPSAQPEKSDSLAQSSASSTQPQPATSSGTVHTPVVPSVASVASSTQPQPATSSGSVHTPVVPSVASVQPQPARIISKGIEEVRPQAPVGNTGATHQQVKSFAQSITANIFKQSNGIAARRKISPGAPAGSMLNRRLGSAMSANEESDLSSPMPTTVAAPTMPPVPVTTAVPVVTTPGIAAVPAGDSRPSTPVHLAAPMPPTAARVPATAAFRPVSHDFGGPSASGSGGGMVRGVHGIAGADTGSRPADVQRTFPVAALNMAAVNALPRRRKDGKPPSPIPAEEGSFV
jgi:hypothetical protein